MRRGGAGQAGGGLGLPAPVAQAQVGGGRAAPLTVHSCLCRGSRRASMPLGTKAAHAG